MGANFSVLIERMRQAGGLKNHSAVAKTLGISPQALSNFKRRGEIPADLVVRFGGIYNLSLDWLFRGEGDMRLSECLPGSAAEAFETVGVEIVAYRKDAGDWTSKVRDTASLTPEEMICVGKVLKVLRQGDKTAADILRFSVDACLNAAESKEKSQAK